MDRLETKVNAELLKAAVQREIFCQFTGAVLDMRRAVLIDDTAQGGAMFVVTATHYDKVAGEIEKLAATRGTVVLDGRKLFTASGSIRYDHDQAAAKAAQVRKDYNWAKREAAAELGCDESEIF